MSTITTKSKVSNFIKVNIWLETKKRLVQGAKLKNQTLAKYIDTLSKPNKI